MKKSELRKIIRESIKEFYEQSQLGDTPPYDGVVNQNDLDWISQNWLQPGDAYNSTDGIVNLGDLTLVSNNYGQGDPGNEGGCDTDCPKSQQARDLFSNNVSNPGNVLPSGFKNKMDSMGCTPLANRRLSLLSKMVGMQSQTPVGGGTMSSFCCGENPMQQAQIMLKIAYMDNILQNQTCA